MVFSSNPISEANLALAFGITPINYEVVGDVVTFDNVGYTIPDSNNNSTFWDICAPSLLAFKTQATTIEGGSFNDFGSIQKITAEQCVNVNGTAVFENCAFLEELTFSTALTTFGATTGDNDLTYNIGVSLTNTQIVVTIPPSLYTDGDIAYLVANRPEVTINQIGVAPVGQIQLSLPFSSSVPVYRSNLSIATTAVPTDEYYDKVNNVYYFNVPANSDFTTGTGHNPDGNGTIYGIAINWIKDPLGLITTLGSGFGFGATGDCILGDVAFTSGSLSTTWGTFANASGNLTFGDCWFDGHNALGSVSGTNTFGNCTFTGDDALVVASGTNTFGTVSFGGNKSLESTSGTLNVESILGLPANNFASNCPGLVINVNSGTQIGNSTGQDCGDFGQGSTLTINVPAAMATSDGGNPDGDLVMAGLNGCTVNYI